jgi:hypothetical protein
MDQKLILRERYLVVSHLEEDRPYRVVGSAYKVQGEQDLTLHLRILPGVSFYMTPHRDRSGWEYVIFSGRNKNSDGGSRFFAKVGSAILLPKKNAVEIHLPDLRQVYYLKLDPQDFHFDEKDVATAA